jgi:hypothetical protein
VTEWLERAERQEGNRLVDEPGDEQRHHEGRRCRDRDLTSSPSQARAHGQRLAAAPKPTRSIMKRP